jgi:hypothetical protein
VADADREDEGAAPLDEDAAWAALVAGFDAEPDPGAAASWPEAENVPEGDAEAKEPPSAKNPAAVAPPPTRSIVIHPVIAGPRNYELEDDEEDAHFVPPEPPPLPASDTTARFAWLGAVGGPILLLLAVLLGWDMTWWLTTACIGGFLGGCATLVVRMHPGDEDDDDPGRGAVV